MKITRKDILWTVTISAVALMFYNFVVYPYDLFYIKGAQFYYYLTDTVYCSNPEDCRHEECHALDASFSSIPIYRNGWMSQSDRFGRYVHSLCNDTSAIGVLAQIFPGICGNDFDEHDYDQTGWGGNLEFYAEACEMGLLPATFMGETISDMEMHKRTPNKTGEVVSLKIPTEFACK